MGQGAERQTTGWVEGEGTECRSIEAPYGRARLAPPVSRTADVPASNDSTFRTLLVRAGSGHRRFQERPTGLASTVGGLHSESNRLQLDTEVGFGERRRGR